MEPHVKKSRYFYVIAGIVCLILIAIIGVKLLAPSFKGHKDMKLKTARNYKEVYQYLQREQVSQDKTGNAKVMPGVATLEMDASGQYSDTNVRENGVGEGDYVKTDGTYLYVLHDSTGKVSIIDTRDTTMKEVSVIEMEKGTQAAELYLCDKKLIIIGISTRETATGSAEDTQMMTYDISDAGNPKKVGQISQSGHYSTLRVVDNMVYLFSTFYANVPDKPKNFEEYIPMIQEELIAKDNIFMPRLQNATMYTVISSVNVEQPEQVVDGRAILSKGSDYYVSDENIYMYESDYSDNGNKCQTTIRKIRYQNGKLEPQGQATIDGTINDSFSIDEYKGNLRVVTTIGQNLNRPEPRELNQVSEQEKRSSENIDLSKEKTTNSVYVMNSELKVIGSIKGLAEEERIYSARFMGDTGYVVTYKEMDPLFSLDLSNPQKPEIIGALKIPGFSEYLHPYKDGLLIGIGQDMDEQGTTSQGVKVSMFDISNPKDVKEVQKYVIEQSYSTDAFYDYKAVLIDAKKDMIGFSVYGDQEKYVLLGYDESEGFYCRMEEEISGQSYMTTRGIYIQDILYIIKGELIESYNLQTHEKIDDIIL